MILDTITEMLMRMNIAAGDVLDDYKDCPQHHEEQAMELFIKKVEVILDEYKKA